MNKTDNKILNLLKKNARASISNIAAELSLTRTTVRNKISKLINNGEILGFTILTKSDVKSSPVRGLVMVEIEGLPVLPTHEVTPLAQALDRTGPRSRREHPEIKAIACVRRRV